MAADPFAKSTIPYHAFVKNLVETIASNATDWGILPAEITAYTPAYTEYMDAYDVAINPLTDTKVNRRTLLMKRTALTILLRPFVQIRLYGNPAVGADGLILCGLAPHLTTHTPSGKPVGAPQFGFTGGSSGHTLIGVYFNTPPGSLPGKKVRGKPKGVHHIEVAYWIGPNPPGDPKDFTAFKTFNKNPMNLSFDAADKGKTVYIYCRWVSTTNINGDWTTNVVEATIP